jgi:2-oxoglutarate dehydrogenase E1 component
MKNEWKGFEQVTDVQMLQKSDTGFPKDKLVTIANAIVICPPIKSLSVKLRN